MIKAKSSAVRTSNRGFSGFTLIELMIVIATIAIVVALALPVYANYTIRAKVGEALSVGASAKTATTGTCVEDPTIAALTPDLAGHAFEASKYVETVVIGGPCVAPVITITTRNTGAVVDPVLTLTGVLTLGSGHMSWTCTGTGLNIHAPKTCRS
jgi:type IV pilus assembly protein PilA